MLYFAYGSNLNADDLSRWCEKNDRPYPLGTVVGRAWLPDFQLVFDHYSRTRQGGVLGVAPRKGYAAPGVVFEVKEGGWETLDLREGAPAVYEPKDVYALVETGAGASESMRCTTHKVLRPEPFVRTSSAYLAVVTGGYEAYNLPPEQLELAVGDLRRPLPLFVYGSLKRKGYLHRAMDGFEFLGEAVVPGRLLDCGHFPGLIEGKDGERVHGELYQAPADDVDALLTNADEVEGFNGYGVVGNLYDRRVTISTDGAGEEAPCWAYIWMRQRDLPVAPGGIWPV
ncbi:hypothetical protein FACS1894205_4840 [Alphaproteobacteria bacterium]|nr:hypothetical protein FACS1894205_4840 [Alphaproteobacteria bacterium]